MSPLHRFVAAICVIFALSSPAAAEHPSSPKQDTGDDVEETAVTTEAMVDELSARFGLDVVDPDRWEARDLRALLDGAETLPEASWEIIDQPLEIEYVPQTCAFSMGRYNRRCPTFGNDEKTRFFIYDAAPVVGEGAVEQLEILTRAEQRDLQLRRAVVHLVMVHLDDQFGWSDDSEWRAINGWPDGSGGALNDDPWGYSRYLGMHSAHLDLVTFAEEFFVRPEDLLLERTDDDETARRRLQSIDPDKTLVCQQFTKRRKFNARLGQVDSDWSEPERRLPHIEAGHPVCPAFETWARPDELKDFEILLAAASAEQPESLFGHLLLHVRYEDGDTVHGEGFEPVYQFGAITATDVDPVEYFTRGFLGGFPSVLELNTFRGIDRLYLQYQQRDLRRYRLNLTDAQSRQLLERIWESERQIRYPYLFLSDNCASFLIDLLMPALDLPVPPRRRAIVMPTDVLDTLAQVDNNDEGALLEKRPDTRRSNLNVAGESVLQRRALVAELLDELEGRPEKRRRLDAVAAQIEAIDPSQRRAAYEEADELFDDILSDDDTLARRVIDLVYHSVLIERYFAERAHLARRSLYAETHKERSPQTIEDILETRREVYRHEDMEARLEIFEELTQESERTFADGPLRELTEPEQLFVDYEETVRETYMDALLLQSTLIDGYQPDWSGVDYLDEHSRAYREEQQRLDEMSKPSSGRNIVSVGGRYTPQAAVGEFDLSYSLVREELGELRRRGFRSNLGTRILGVDATVPFTPDGLTDLQMELVALRYQNIRRTHGPLRQSIADWIGWGIDGRLVHDGRRNLWASAEVTSSALIPVITGSDDVDHLVAHTGFAIRYDVYRDQNPLLGATAGLFGQLHLYGDYSNVLRVGAEMGQYVGFGPQWRYDVTGRAESRHLIGRFSQRSMMLVPFVEGLWTTRDYRDDVSEPGFRSWSAGLEVELPF